MSGITMLNEINARGSKDTAAFQMKVCKCATKGQSECILGAEVVVFPIFAAQILYLIIGHTLRFDLGAIALANEPRGLVNNV